MKKLLLFALSLITLQFVTAQDTWTRKADFGGTARYAATGFSIGSKGYIGTGRDQTGDKKDFWEYDPSANTWTQKADFGGTARYYATGFSIGTKGYIGTGENSGTREKDFWEYDPSANTWTRKADFGGTARHTATGFSIGSEGYIGTGYDGTYRKDFWKYDPSVNSWTQRADYGGTGRSEATGFSIGSKGYIGTGAEPTGIKKDFWEYNPALDMWTQKADFGGTARYGATGFSIGTKGYLGTGFSYGELGPQPNSLVKDFWEYDQSSNTWTRKADFGGDERYAATGFRIGNKGYIGTGLTQVFGVYAGASYRSDFWEYTPAVAVPPTVATGSATLIGPNSAYLSATINPNGNSVTFIIEFGTTTSYGNSVNPSDNNPITGNTNTTLGHYVRSGLISNTLYHYRAFYSSSIYGSDSTFYTLAGTPTKPVVSNPTSSTLTVAIGANDGNPSYTQYAIHETSTNKYVQADGSLGITPVFQNASVWGTKTVTGLAPATTYTFEVKAKNEINIETEFGPYAAATTAGQALAPTATTGGANVVKEESAINQYAQIGGTVNANGSTTTVSFEYGSTTGYGSTISGSPGTVTGNSNTAVSATINRLPPNQLYHYRIVAQNAGGTTFGEDSTFYTLVYIPNAPIISDPTATTLRVNIDYASPNSGNTMYVIRETTTGKYVQSDGSLGTTLASSGGGIVTGLSPNTTYSFQVGARSDANGSILYGPSASGTTLTLPTLTTNAPGSITANSAELRGTVNANGRSAQVYFQYGKTTAYGSLIYATNVTSNSNTAVAKVLTGLEANQLYHYRLYAEVLFSSGKDVANGNDVAFYTLANTPTAPVVSNPAFSSLGVGLGGQNGNQFYTSYAIRETSTNKYVQADGSLGTSLVFLNQLNLGYIAVLGLLPATTYTFQIGARQESNGEIIFGPSASGTTLSQNVITYVPKDLAPGDLSLTSSWVDQMGNSPANFTSPNQIFLIQPRGIYRASVFVGGPWTISGGSKVSLGHQYNLVFLPRASLNIGTGSEVDFHNNPVILKSDATGTASIGTISGTLSNATFVIAERFIPARRAWRMINVPLESPNTQTFGRGFVNQSIYTAWQVATIRISPNQDGQNPGSLSPGGPGFGTHITGGSVAQGFDQSPTNSSSIKTYDNATDNWLPVPNTNATSVSSNVFMLFVRGDRTIDLSKGTAAPPTNTVLFAGGTLRTGDQTFAVNATGFTPIPNPYPSAINFATITKNNVQNSFYVWDPKMSGPDGVGAFVNVSFNGSTYDVTPTPASPINQYIQSHQSFLVRSTGAAGSLVIKETDKSTGGSDNVFRTGGVSQNMRVNLMVTNADNTTSVADGVLSSYSTDFSNAIDDMDAVKMTNFNENIGIVRNGQTLTVERRSAISLSDTIFLKLWNTAQKSYHLQFDPANFSSSAIAAYLVDNYLRTSTPVSMSSISDVEFSVTANAASAAADRFMVVFKANSTLPVNFTTIKAYQQNSNVQVDWNVATESNILSYEIEKSSNGVMFTKAGTVAAKANNNAAVAYNWMDVAPYVGNNYYRIKAVTLTGDVKYTQVVNVKTAKGRSEITAYPNPLIGRTINIQLVNQPAGTYTVELMNNIGQVMYRSQIKHLGGSSAQTLDLDNKPAQGVYQMKISNGDTKKTIQIICN